MGHWWQSLRGVAAPGSPPDRPAGSVPAAPAGQVGVPAWQRVPSISRAVTAISPVAPHDTFAASLVTARRPGLLEPLGHHIDTDGPFGTLQADAVSARGAIGPEDWSPDTQRIDLPLVTGARSGGSTAGRTTTFGPLARLVQRIAAADPVRGHRAGHSGGSPTDTDHQESALDNPAIHGSTIHDPATGEALMGVHSDVVRLAPGDAVGERNVAAIDRSDAVAGGGHTTRPMPGAENVPGVQRSAVDDIAVGRSLSPIQRWVNGQPRLQLPVQDPAERHFPGPDEIAPLPTPDPAVRPVGGRPVLESLESVSRNPAAVGPGAVQRTSGHLDPDATPGPSAQRMLDGRRAGVDAGSGDGEPPDRPPTANAPVVLRTTAHGLDAAGRPGGSSLPVSHLPSARELSATPAEPASIYPESTVRQQDFISADPAGLMQSRPVEAMPTQAPQRQRNSSEPESDEVGLAQLLGGASTGFSPVAPGPVDGPRPGQGSAAVQRSTIRNGSPVPLGLGAPLAADARPVQITPRSPLPGNRTAGNTTPGNTTPGNTAGGNTAGGNTAGGNTAGGTTTPGQTTAVRGIAGARDDRPTSSRPVTPPAVQTLTEIADRVILRDPERPAAQSPDLVAEAPGGAESPDVLPTRSLDFGAANNGFSTIGAPWAVGAEPAAGSRTTGDSLAGMGPVVDATASRSGPAQPAVTTAQRAIQDLGLLPHPAVRSAPTVGTELSEGLLLRADPAAGGPTTGTQSPMLIQRNSASQPHFDVQRAQGTVLPTGMGIPHASAAWPIGRVTGDPGSPRSALANPGTAGRHSSVLTISRPGTAPALETHPGSPHFTATAAPPGGGELSLQQFASDRTAQSARMDSPMSGGGTPTVQTLGEPATAAEPTPPATAAEPAPPAVPPTEFSAAAAPSPSSPPLPTDLDELARRLFDPLSARLKTELWMDRERAGLITDLR